MGYKGDVSKRVTSVHPSEAVPQVPLIGNRLRTARHGRRLTIRDVASASGLTAGFISRLERDEVQPSVASLVRLCEALGLRVGSLFDRPEMAVVRRGKGQPINFGGVKVAETLVTPGRQTRLQVIHADMEPGGNGGPDLYSLDSEIECVYVLAGRLVVTNEMGDVDLGRGDAMTFPAREPHTWRNASNARSCEVLWILSPSP